MKKVIVIVGPTGSGKTDLSLEVAKYLNTEIISGDSVQVYKGLDIGSGKIKDKKNIKHHLIDIKDPIDDYSVFDFQKSARKIIEEISSKSMIPVICGGTGLYIKALLYDYNLSSSKRTDKFDNLSNEEIYDRLVELNDKELPDVHNRRKLLRHLEIYSSNNDFEIRKDVPLYDALIIGIKVDRTILYDRINNRVDVMIKDGLIDEVKSLYDKGIRSKAVSSIGYRELYEYFDGLVSLDDAIENIKKDSRHFAKRQYTWFNNQMDVKWIQTDGEDRIKEAIELIRDFIKDGN